MKLQNGSSSMKTIRLINEQTLDSAINSIRQIKLDGSMEVVIQPNRDTRSSQQSRLMWSLLGQISEQVSWHGNKLTAENWKDILTSSLKKQKVVPGLDNNFVVCGTSTRKMTIKEMNEVIELAMMFGNQQNVRFKAESRYENK